MKTNRTLHAAALCAGLLALSACTGFSHRESQERLTDDYQALVEAEKVALVEALRAGGGASPDAALLLSAEPPRSLMEARLRLALDAQQDLEASNAGFADASEADRISALYRAALKGWHAGNAWEDPRPESGLNPDTPSEVHRQGTARCAELGAQAPQRDCAIIATGLELTAMEIAGSDIFDAHLARLSKAEPDEDLVALRVEGVRDISQAMARLDAMATPQQLSSFFDAQRLAYFCQSVRALDDLFALADREWAGRALAEEAALVLMAGQEGRQVSPGLADLLRLNAVEGESYVGAYARLLDRIEPLVSKDWAVSDLAGPKLYCSSWEEARA